MEGRRCEHRRTAEVLRLDAPGEEEPLRIPCVRRTTWKIFSPDVNVECAGMSTTSSGGWHLGLLSGKSAGNVAKKRLISRVINRNYNKGGREEEEE